jgi:hypothetical protein
MVQEAKLKAMTLVQVYKDYLIADYWISPSGGWN